MFIFQHFAQFGINSVNPCLIFNVRPRGSRGGFHLTNSVAKFPLGIIVFS